MANKKICYAAGCLRPLPAKASKYCSTRCRNRISQQKKRAKAKGIEWTQEDDVVNIPSQNNVRKRRGKIYTDIKESGYAQQILEKKVTMSEVAKILDTSVASVSMAYNAWVEDTETEIKQKNWEIPQVAEKSLEDLNLELGLKPLPFFPLKNPRYLNF